MIEERKRYGERCDRCGKYCYEVSGKPIGEPASTVKKKTKKSLLIAKSITEFIKLGCDYIVATGGIALCIYSMLSAGTIKTICYIAAAMVIGFICKDIIKRIDNTEKED